MPDVREVYEMVTKQKPPEPGALERQQKRQVRAARNRKLGAFTVTAVIGLAALVLVLTKAGQNTRTPAHQPTTPPPTVAPGKAFFLDLRTGKQTSLADGLAGGYSYVPSPDGTKVAFNSNSGGGCVGTEGITVANLDGTDPQTITSPEGLTICAPRWSPDGKKLVYQERDGADELSVGNLFVYDLSTRRRTQITHLALTKAWWWFLSPRFTPIAGDAFSGDVTGPGNVIFHLPRGSGERTTWDVWSVPVTGGEPTLVLRNAAFPLIRPFGPEGLRIQFVVPTANDFSGMSIMTGRPSPESDIRQTLADAPSSIWWPTMSPDGNKIAYQVDGSIYVVDVFSREVSKVADGNTAEWLGDHTLIVAP